MLVFFGGASFVGAQGASATANTKAQSALNQQTAATKSATASSQGQSKSDEAKNKNDDQGNDKELNSTAQTHRSVVANAVQQLLKVADRERGIGTEVRVIAQAQQDQAETVAVAAQKVETRSKFKTFLFGTDYKNIGVIRSALVTTDEQIAKLQALVAKATTTDSKATLNAQIDALKAEQVKLQAFIDAHKNVFSLFGWLAKK